MPKKVLIPLAEGFEELEAVTVIDVMRRAEIQVTVASLSDGTQVRASRGCCLIADMTLDHALQSSYDMVVLPGGLPGAHYLADDERILHLVQHMWSHDKFVAAICAAPKVLDRAGILDGKRITCYPNLLASHQAENLTLSSALVEVDGSVITGKGPGAALDFALTLVAILQGEGVRESVEQALHR